MFTPNNHIQQEHFANITDYSASCPKGMKRFCVFVYFTDQSHCMCDYIFAVNRSHALVKSLERFEDCLDYIQSVSLHGEDGQ